MAEAERFELSKGYKPLPVFKTGAFNRSAKLPFCVGYYNVTILKCKCFFKKKSQKKYP